MAGSVLGATYVGLSAVLSGGWSVTQTVRLTSGKDQNVPRLTPTVSPSITRGSMVNVQVKNVGYQCQSRRFLPITPPHTVVFFFACFICIY